MRTTEQRVMVSYWLMDSLRPVMPPAKLMYDSTYDGMISYVDQVLCRCT